MCTLSLLSRRSSIKPLTGSMSYPIRQRQKMKRFLFIYHPFQPLLFLSFALCVFACVCVIVCCQPTFINLNSMTLINMLYCENLSKQEKTESGNWYCYGTKLLRKLIPTDQVSEVRFMLSFLFPLFPLFYSIINSSLPPPKKIISRHDVIHL